MAAFGSGVYFAMRQALYVNLDESIQAQAAILIGSVRYEGGQRTLVSGSSSGDPEEDESLVRIFDASGTLTDDSRDPVGAVAVNATAIGHALAGRTVSFGSGRCPSGEMAG